MAKHLVQPGHAPAKTGLPIAVTVEEEGDVAAFANSSSADFAPVAEEDDAPAAAPAPAPAAAPAPSAPVVQASKSDQPGGRLFASPFARPIALGLLLISYVAVKRLEDGVPIYRLPLDFKLLSAFMYTGALLAIYLSYYYFFVQLPAR